MSAEGMGFSGDEFREPGPAHRALPFWAWNARMDKIEIAAQIRSFKRAGMGGFFMHSRDGLETPYLGEEWMDAVREAIRVAGEEGLSAWLYDEDRWPSGASGGKVPALGEAYRAKGLTLEVRDGDYIPCADTVALFSVRIDGAAWREGERLDPSSTHRARPGASFLVFRIEAAAGDEWFNGEAPPDNMNPDAVDAFIRMNYEPYRAAVGDHFGKTVPGIFTDEPSVHDRHSRYAQGRGWIPWTFGFAEFFAERRGYDPYDRIPLVFFEGKGQEAIRHDYWRTVAERFSETYSKRISEWCGRHGLAFTGHFLWENQLGVATRTGGAIMPHYRFQQVPGIDMLCEQIDETITVKQCTSVANQFGRPRVISETYGCTGWEFNFEGQKWLGDWQFAMGVNVRSQHLALYSLKGCRKRDYPPVFNCNTNWWRQAAVVEDYFARLSTALSAGKPARDILVLHPASTAWCSLGSNPRGFASREADSNIQEVNRFGDEFNRLLRALLGAHYDFDLGDETILAEEGRVDGSAFEVKFASYRLVLIPPIGSMLESTRALLAEFLEAGGRAVAMLPVATLLEGRPSDRPAALYTHPNTCLAADPQAALRAVEALLPRRVSLTNAYCAEDPDLICSYRVDGESEAVLFAANTDRSKAKDILVDIEGGGLVEELDPLDGTIKPIAVLASGGRTKFLANFGPAGSRLYRIDRKRPPEHAAGGTNPAAFPPATNYLAPPPILRGFGPVARFARTAPNALVLDRCAFSLGDADWSGEMEVWRAQKEIREKLGMRQVYYNGLAQRYLWTSAPHAGDGAPVRFRFRFLVKEIPAGDLYLALEDPGEFAITMNGEALSSAASGWFLDTSIEKVRLPAPAIGWNELVLSCAYKNSMEVEDCFLLGDFAVDAQRALAAEPDALRFGDWCLQGYPHYCGSMAYRFDLEWPRTGQEPRDKAAPRRAILRLGDFSAVTVAVKVNGETLGQIPWRSANGLDISAALRPGRNELEIEVVGSPRNLLGPFHLARGKVAFNEWSAFRPEGKDFTLGYVLQPYGLFGQVTLSRE